ncbi:MAG: hypothetical protein HY755_03835 [Nitrospirae bacterium]|nr:hypothetical protein [Nitrospirota bacterium]
MDNLKELIQWVGLISWIGAGLCLSIIGIRYAKGLIIPISALGKELKSIDIKLAKAAGILFLTELFLFIIVGLPINRR